MIARICQISGSFGPRGQRRKEQGSAMKSAAGSAQVIEQDTKPANGKAGTRRAAIGTNIDQATHNKIISFLWGIADDVLRDLFKRGKYPDVILPMCVLRRLDAVLEPTKQAVLDAKKLLDTAGITEQRAVLCQASGQAFYNTSKFTLRDLRSRGNHQQLAADFDA
jgi:hypothetical protein